MNYDYSQSYCVDLPDNDIEDLLRYNIKTPVITIITDNKPPQKNNNKSLVPFLLVVGVMSLLIITK